MGVEDFLNSSVVIHVSQDIAEDLEVFVEDEDGGDAPDADGLHGAPSYPALHEGEVTLPVEEVLRLLLFGIYGQGKGSQTVFLVIAGHLVEVRHSLDAGAAPCSPQVDEQQTSQVRETLLDLADPVGEVGEGCSRREFLSLLWTPLCSLGLLVAFFLRFALLFYEGEIGLGPFWMP